MEEVRVDAERKWEGIRSQADPLIAQMTALAQDTRVLHAVSSLPACFGSQLSLH